MNKRKSVLNKDHHLIRITADERNAKVRDSLKANYKRIRREKESPFWRWYYRWMTIRSIKKRLKLVDKRQNRKSTQKKTAF